LVTELMTGQVCAINRLDSKSNSMEKANRIFFKNFMDGQL